MKEKTKPIEAKTYYYIEVSQDVNDHLRAGCKMLEQILVGNLNPLKEIILEAYKRRVGETAPIKVQENIEDMLRGLESLGWNLPIVSTSPCRGALLYRDIWQTLDAQQAILDDPTIEVVSVEHNVEDIPLIRTIDVLNTTQKRLKPLKTFVTEPSKRRRI